MRYLSLCSGIEAATVAWEPLGWEPFAFAEIEKFPSAVLAHHYPHIPNLGDITQISGKDFRGKIDLIVGGPPCQAFSAAGLRTGMDDPRGQLSLVFLRIVGEARPRWIVIENVPGLLSSDHGRAFEIILRQMAKFGYGFAWRVLDAAKNFGVPQRRRRVYIVGHLGDWRPAAAVLFERHCLSGDTAPRRETRKDIAGTITTRTGRGGGINEDVDNGKIIPSLTAGAPFARTGNSRVESESAVICPTLRAGGNRTGGNRPPGTDVDTAESLVVAHTLRGEAFDASEDGTGRANLIPINLQVATRHNALGERTALGIGQDGDPAFTLTKTHSHGVFIGAEQFPMTFAQNQLGEIRLGNAAGTLNQNSNASGRNTPMVFDAGLCAAVRRLTPRECERLQGFPDDYTMIPWRGKPAALCPDGPRYKAIGNSMAVPVMRWIGERIDWTENIMRDAA
jgi:DNA (cytosine-5)-methyltransferase 1